MVNVMVVFAVLRVRKTGAGGVVSRTLHSPSPWRGSATAAKIDYTAVTGDRHGDSLLRAQPPARLEKELFVKQQVPCVGCQGGAEGWGGVSVAGAGGRGEGGGVGGILWRECDRCDTMSSWTNTDGLHLPCVPVVLLPSFFRLPPSLPLPFTVLAGTESQVEGRSMKQ